MLVAVTWAALLVTAVASLIGHWCGERSRRAARSAVFVAGAAVYVHLPLGSSAPVDVVSALAVASAAGYTVGGAAVARRARKPPPEPAAPEATPAPPMWSGELALITERLSTGSSPSPIADLIRAWELVYGGPPDLTRPLPDIVDELAVAINAAAGPDAPDGKGSQR